MSERTKWQYQVVELSEQAVRSTGGNKLPWNDLLSVTARLRELGDEGWELVTAMPSADQDGCTRKVVLFLKRSQQ